MLLGIYSKTIGGQDLWWKLFSISLNNYITIISLKINILNIMVYIVLAFSLNYILCETFFKMIDTLICH